MGPKGSGLIAMPNLNMDLDKVGHDFMSPNVENLFSTIRYFSF